MCLGPPARKTTNISIGELLADAWNANAANHIAGKSHELQLARPGMRLLLGESFCDEAS
jgi:hypothetical protein